MLLDPSGEQKIIYFIKAIIVNSWVLTFLKKGNPFSNWCLVFRAAIDCM